VSPFQPLGTEARWRTLYGLLQQKGIGDVLTYEEMADALEMDPVSDRQALQVTFRRAAIQYEEDDRRAVDAVRGVGYRIVEPSEHLKLAKRHGKKAGNQLKLAYSKAVNVDLSGESSDVVKAFELVALGFAHQMEVNRRQAATNQRTQRALANASIKIERTDDEVNALRERMEALEKRLTGE
jgi:hypothetical protein